MTRRSIFRMRVGLKLNEEHDLSTKYLCESRKIRLRQLLRMDGGDLGDVLITLSNSHFSGHLVGGTRRRG